MLFRSGSIGEYKDGKVDATIYGDFPKQEFIYLHYLPVESFRQTNIDAHQFVSDVAVKPIKTEKIIVKDYLNLFRVGTKEEADAWAKKYK